MVKKASDLVVDFAVDYIVSQTVKRIIEIVAAKVPFLAWGPFGIIVNYFATKFLRFAMHNTVLGLHIFAVDRQLAYEGFRLRRSLMKAHDLNASESEKKKADEEVKKHLRHFVSVG